MQLRKHQIELCMKSKKFPLVEIRLHKAEKNCIISVKFGSRSIFVFKVRVAYFNCKKLLLMNDCSLMITLYISESISLFLSTKEAELKLRANASS